MRKQQLVATVASKSGLPKADVSKVVDATLDAITDALKKNDDLRLVGFGTQPLVSAARLPAKKQAKFRPGKKLSEELEEPEATTHEPEAAVPDEAALEVAAALLDNANRRVSRLRRDVRKSIAAVS